MALTARRGFLETTGSEWSADAQAEIRRMQEREDHSVPTDFNGLARFMGYKPGSLRAAIGDRVQRDQIVSALRMNGVRFHGNDQLLATSYMAEVSGSQLMAAAE